MTPNPNELTIENSAVVLIDHQPWVAFAVESVDKSVLINNVTGLALAARALGVPTVLTTVGAKGSVLADPIFSQISDVFPEVTPVDRTTTNAWSDPNLRVAVEATGRKKLVMAGLWTEVCLAQTALSALKDGFEVYFVSDASGGVSKEAHEDAKARMIQAGARPVNWMGVLAEWTPDYTSPERSLLTDVLLRHGGGVSLAVQYMFAQVTAGLVPMPTFKIGEAMSSISTLLVRNLADVFGENDPVRRRAAIDEIFAEDCVFHEPRGVYRGRDEIERVAGEIKATHPDFRYQPIAEPEELGNGGRIQWVSGRPGEAPAYAGTDFIIARDGRIAAVYLFFDRLP